MWFYIPAAIVIVVFALWFRRTNLYRHHRRGHGVDPGQVGSSRSIGPPGPPMGGSFPG